MQIWITFALDVHLTLELIHLLNCNWPLSLARLGTDQPFWPLDDVYWMTLIIEVLRALLLKINVAFFRRSGTDSLFYFYCTENNTCSYNCVYFFNLYIFLKQKNSPAKKMHYEYIGGIKMAAWLHGVQSRHLIQFFSLNNNFFCRLRWWNGRSNKKCAVMCDIV